MPSGAPNTTTGTAAGQGLRYLWQSCAWRGRDRIRKPEVGSNATDTSTDNQIVV